MRAKIAYSVLACLTMAALFVPVSRPEDFVEYTKVGSEVPSFTLTTLDGREFSTAAARGKVVLLNFWATWCPPCVIEMPRLEEEIWKEHRGPDFEMLAVAREQTGAEIREYRDKNKYSFPMAPDPRRAAFGKFANAGIPRNYVIGRDGRILYQSVGYTPQDFAKMKRILEKELAR